jgi:hypothetical protein
MSQSIARWSCGISLWSAALNLGLGTPWRFALFSCPSITRAEALPTVNEAQLLPDSIRCKHLFIDLQQLVLGTQRRDRKRRLSA